MKTLFQGFLFALMLVSAACTSVNAPGPTSSPVPRRPELQGVFRGITPCSSQTRPLPQIPADADCEQMTWSLVLYQDPETGTPTSYRLESAYGRSKPNTNDLVGGGTPIVMQGTWTIATGTKTDSKATVYQIQAGDSPTTVSFLKVSDNLLHILSSEKTLLVGNGAWSYTLNRMDNQNPAAVSTPPNSLPDPPTRPPLPPAPEGSSVFGAFEGRTPCHALVIEVLQITPRPDCLKIKWRITLYQEEATGAPGTYLSMGTSTFREGTWEIVRGTADDPQAVLYRLYLDHAQEPVSFLRVDENHLFLLDRALNLLVGNELFSYTLSRADPKIPE